MKENIEEDLKKTENLIECFRKAEIVNLECKESMYQRCNYSHYKAIEHILSDYKRVLKENEELKEEAIERINNDIAKPLYCGDITICNIDDLKTVLSMLEEKDKVIDLMAEKIEKGIGNVCPLNDYNYDLNCENECKDDYKKCWKQYFENKVRQESDKGATGK